MLHTRAGREAAPARDPAARRRENPRMHTPTDQSRRSRRAKAARWDEAEFRWRAGMTCKISSRFNCRDGAWPVSLRERRRGKPRLYGKLGTLHGLVLQSDHPHSLRTFLPGL